MYICMYIDKNILYNIFIYMYLYIFQILAIHGYAQSDVIFKTKLGSLRKGFKKEVDFTFLRAPHKVPMRSNFNIDTEEDGIVFYEFYELN